MEKYNFLLFFMQVTNYGLGGLCEQHIDPHGYLEGNELPRSRENLKYTGDMIGTFMAWLKDVGAGGGTSYLVPGKEMFISIYSSVSGGCDGFC